MTTRTADDLQVVLLGTGTPNAEPDRFGSAIAIIAGQTPYLIDFGPGVVRRAAAAHQNGIEALEVSNLRRAFLTHLHSDHTAGYPDLIFTPWVLGRDKALHVHGPAGLQTMTEHVLMAYGADARQRLDGLEPANANGYHVSVHEIEPGPIFQDGKIAVHAFRVQHGTWPAFGYKFVSPSRTIVISGDTAPVEEIARQCNGCDVLIHEVYSVAGFKTLPPEWQRYHEAAHTSPHELAEIATQARPKLLILYHQLFWGSTETELLAEINQFYEGRVVSGKDLEVY